MKANENKQLHRTGLTFYSRKLSGDPLFLPQVKGCFGWSTSLIFRFLDLGK